MAEINDKRISSLRGQDKKYNELYRKWRQDRTNKFGYYVSGVQDEHTYRDGKGFAGEYPEADERETLELATTLLMKVLIVYTLIEFAFKLLFSDHPFPPFLGVILYREGFTSDHDPLHIAVSMLTNILSRLLPLVYLLVKLKLPIQLAVPLKISNKPLFRCSVPIAMLTFGIIYTCDKIYSVFIPASGGMRPLFPWDGRFTVKDVPELMLFAVIIPILSEVVHRGVFMQMFRQFGDGFALFMSSIISALLATEDSFMACFVYSLMIGYCTLRTGSVITAVIMRVIITGLYFTLDVVTGGTLDGMAGIAVSLTVLFCLGIGMIMVMRFVSNSRNRISLPLHHLYLTDTEKVMMVVSNPTFIVWITFFIVSTMWSVTFGR